MHRRKYSPSRTRLPLVGTPPSSPKAFAGTATASTTTTSSSLDNNNAKRDRRTRLVTSPSSTRPRQRQQQQPFCLSSCLGRKSLERICSDIYNSCCQFRLPRQQQRRRRHIMTWLSQGNRPWQFGTVGITLFTLLWILVLNPLPSLPVVQPWLQVKLLPPSPSSAMRQQQQQQQHDAVVHNSPSPQKRQRHVQRPGPWQGTAADVAQSDYGNLQFTKLPDDPQSMRQIRYSRNVDQTRVGVAGGMAQDSSKDDREISVVEDDDDDDNNNSATCRRPVRPPTPLTCLDLHAWCNDDDAAAATDKNDSPPPRLQHSDVLARTFIHQDYQSGRLLEVYGACAGTILKATHTATQNLATLALPTYRRQDDCRNITLQRLSAEEKQWVNNNNNPADDDDDNRLPIQYNDLNATTKLEFALQMAESIALFHNDENGIVVHGHVHPTAWLVSPTSGTLWLQQGRSPVQFLHYDEIQHEYCRYENGVATGDFMSPEEYMDLPLDEKIDIYSLGNTFYTLLTGVTPLPDECNEAKISQRIQNGERPFLDPAWDQSSFAEALLVRIIRHCWRQHPENRPSAGELVTMLRTAVQNNRALLAEESAMEKQGGALLASEQ